MHIVDNNKSAKADLLDAVRELEDEVVTLREVIADQAIEIANLKRSI